MGSPPRVRGKVDVDRQIGVIGGITPARAGKRLNVCLIPTDAQDHPRACGEKLCALIRRKERLGSPPRVRGKVCEVSLWTAHRRITPARAGKRGQASIIVNSDGVHPRACGEKSA